MFQAHRIFSKSGSDFCKTFRLQDYLTLVVFGVALLMGWKMGEGIGSSVNCSRFMGQFEVKMAEI